jgi:xylan 1,4-beta-xylosidase
VVSREDDGWRLTASGDGPVFVGRRQEHLFARVRARLDVTGTGGLSLRIDPRHALDLEVSDGTVRAVWAVGDVRHELGRADLTGNAELELRALPSQGHEFSTARGPDRVVAGIVVDGEFAALGEVDGRYLSTEVAGGMTGRMAGVVSWRGSVLVRSFSYLGADDAAVVGGGAADPQPWAAT